MTGREPDMIGTEEALGREPIPGDRRLSYGDGPHRFGDLRLPGGEGPAPLAVLVHGGCWRPIADLHYMDALAEWLRSLGWASWNVEFPRLGHPGASWPGLMQAVGAAADHARAPSSPESLDLDRVVSVGHSSGGHLALWLAARAGLPAGGLRGPDPLRFHGVVSLAGIADLVAFDELALRGCSDAVRDLLGGSPAERSDRVAVASPAALLPLGVPQLLVAGEADPDVPAEHAVRYARAARAAGDEVRVDTIPKAGHFEVVAPWGPRWPRVAAGIQDFLDGIRERGPRA